MLRSVHWPGWAALGVILAGYLISGFWLATNGTAEFQLYKWGLLGLTVAPVILMIAYTATGNKWWSNDLGSALAVLSFGITWTAWPLAYTFWFLHGVLSTSWLAWFEVSGPALVAAAILRLCYIFLRYHRDEGKKK